MTVFIFKGDKPLTKQQAENRGVQYFDLEKRQWMREQQHLVDKAGYEAWALEWVQHNIVNTENNEFNKDLYAYREALERLARYRLADGRPALTEEQETGQFDENGDPITETVVTHAAIDPLPATIEQPVNDPEINELTGVETVPNPLIVKDDAERAEAQAVIDATNQDVKDFHASQP